MSKRKDIRNFYVPVEFQETYEIIAKFCQQEGYSISKVIRDLLLDWWDKHRPGNPQITLNHTFPVTRKPDLECYYLLKRDRGWIYCSRYTIWGPLSRCEKCPLKGGT